MRAARIHQAQPGTPQPLQIDRIERPDPAAGEILLEVAACGLCHTDLHLIDGELAAGEYPLIPGHQIVGRVAAVGEGVDGWQVGDRAGVSWLYQADGTCQLCANGLENLCAEAEFTGKDHPGGMAEFALANADFALKLPPSFDDEMVAPLLCAGIIGYRALRQSDLQPGERLGLVGFGASAHLAIQVAVHWQCPVYVFTRSPSHRQLASSLGAVWVGVADDEPPEQLDRAIIFAPAGQLVPKILAKLRPGGTLAINAVHMTEIPAMPYDLIYGERSLRSVANLTRQDARDFLALAAEIPIKPTVATFPLDEINDAVSAMRASEIDGAAVILP